MTRKRRSTYPIWLWMLAAALVALSFWPPSSEVTERLETRREMKPVASNEAPAFPISPIAREATPEIVSSPPPTPKPPTPPPPMRVRARDMASREPVAGLLLACGDRAATTDANGIARFREDPCDPEVAAEGGEWHHGWLEPDRQRDGESTLWVYRNAVVRGRITFESPVTTMDLDRVTLEVVGDQSAPGEPNSRGFKFKVLSHHGLSRLDLSKEVAPDGGFEFEVPGIPGYRLHARAPGWQPDSALLTSERIQVVRLRLTKRSLTVRGTLRDTSGAPVAGARVTAYVLVTMPLAELDRTKVLAAGHGCSIAQNRRLNNVLVKYQISARTGSDGAYTISSNVKGRLVVIASPSRDFHPATAERRSLDDDVSDLDLTVSPGVGRKVRVESSGSPYHGRIILIDVSRLTQNTVIPDLSVSNEFYMARLVPGHQYSVLVCSNPSLSLHFVWDEREVIDLATLNRKPDLSKIPDQYK